MLRALAFFALTAASYAATIVSVSGPIDFTGAIGSSQAMTVGFTTGQAYNSVTISALISGLAGQTVDAYLTTSIGAGTTVADEVASGVINLPGFNPGVLTPVFAGLNLAPGSYYLTLFNPDNNSGGWSSTETPTVFDVPGSSYDFSGYFITNAVPLPYPPGATFVDLSTQDGRTLIFSVDTVSVPEPGTWLVGVGLALLALGRWRRR